MVRRTRTQRTGDLAESCVTGLALGLFGIAVMLGPIDAPLGVIPQSSFLGAALVVAGGAFVTSSIREYRAYLRDVRGARAARATD